MPLFLKFKGAIEYELGMGTSNYSNNWVFSGFVDFEKIRLEATFGNFGGKKGKNKIGI
jgi:hypothetical protein